MSIKVTYYCPASGDRRTVEFKGENEGSERDLFVKLCGEAYDELEFDEIIESINEITGEEIIL